MARANSSTSLDATILDGASLFDAMEILGERFSRSQIKLDYGKLRQRLDALRREADWRPATLSTILLSLDPASEGQQRFMTMLNHSGFEPDVIHFRDAFASLPPGRSPGEAATKSQVSLAARIAYIAGLMLRHPDPHFLVVSHSFELCGPLTDLARRLPKGKVGLAYFGTLLDYRWKSAGLFDGQLGIEFFDLDEWGQELVGIELISRPGAQSDARTGLARF
jgi:hypothetical protein